VLLVTPCRVVNKQVTFHGGLLASFIFTVQHVQYLSVSQECVTQITTQLMDCRAVKSESEGIIGGVGRNFMCSRSRAVGVGRNYRWSRSRKELYVESESEGNVGGVGVGVVQSESEGIIRGVGVGRNYR
jgi:hypothetical protein